MFWPNQHQTWMDRRGATELLANIKVAVDQRLEALGVICVAKDLNGDPRTRKSFDNENLFLLEFAKDPDGLVGYIVGEVSAQEAIQGRVSHRMRPVAYALDDLGEPPEGSLNPDRVQGKSSGFRRDTAVRAYVRQRAKGKCEYCGSDGFVMQSGERYLETHHIISLASLGPDTPQNVIALCAEDHRRAHYGLDAEKLEREFLKKIEAKR